MLHQTIVLANLVTQLIFYKIIIPLSGFSVSSNVELCRCFDDMYIHTLFVRLLGDAFCAKNIKRVEELVAGREY